MNEYSKFGTILKDARAVFKTIKPTSDCPMPDVLVDIIYGHPKGEIPSEVEKHVQDCEACQIMMLKIEADHHQWKLGLHHTPEATLADALGSAGQQSVNKIMAAEASASSRSFISRIKESMVSWVSPIWQPLLAGEPATALDIPEQAKRFEMDHGEYIHISCYWQGKDTTKAPYIHLSWVANLIQPSRLWARFAESDTQQLLSEIPLGRQLKGSMQINYEDLGFDPTEQNWAIAIVIESL